MYKIMQKYEKEARRMRSNFAVQKKYFINSVIFLYTLGNLVPNETSAKGLYGLLEALPG